MLIGYVVRQPAVLCGEFEHPCLFAGPALGSSDLLKVIRPLAIADSPVSPDPRHPFVFAEYWFAPHRAHPLTENPKRKKVRIEGATAARN